MFEKRSIVRFTILLNFPSLETHAFDGKEESVSLVRQNWSFESFIQKTRHLFDEPLLNLDAPTAQGLCRYLLTSKVGVDCHGDYAFR